MGTGVSKLDTMLGGGLRSFSSTMVLGTPGAGKTLLGLSFLDAGARQGESGLIAAFHETQADIAKTASGIGLDIARHIDEGLVRVMWDPPLEISADAWAWRLLETVEEFRPRRVFIDALTDIEQFVESPQRTPQFIEALTNELRSLGATIMYAVEVDAFTAEHLDTPVPAVSPVMDSGILVRHVELRSELRRLVSVLKARQSSTDPTIREFTISDQGIAIHDTFPVSSGLLTGRALPETQSRG